MYKNLPILPILRIRTVGLIIDPRQYIVSLSCLVFNFVFKILPVYLNKSLEIERYNISTIIVFGSILLVKDWAEFNYNYIKRPDINYLA
jgi:small basic protein